MALQLLPLCDLPKVTTRDGYVGANAHFILPFYQFGYWFASGQQYTFPNSLVAQDPSLTLGGTHKPDTYQKDCCSCLSG
jgi:hypothetical protein